ncbi:cell death-inducing p53-target protein 1 [Rhipicephalus sanguineus]|uniref:cell death-inducing p53-target protein 1 n=1 Tax=Rhipicephalus sanguineus TaxID=34632 RepID=UPI0020C56ECC|nr:cell death-inducing p53-target protein 1 [Rhipicephalus sanguineus]
MAGEPMKVPPPGYAEPPPSYQASMQGFQISHCADECAAPGFPPSGTQPPPPPGFAASAPPPGGAPPGGPAPYAAWLPQGTAVPTVVVNVAEWGPYPVQLTCPNCGAQVLTATSTRPGLLTWLLSGACVLFGCWLGCCLIPCCIPECQDVDHHCPSCKRHLCTYRRL